MKKHVSLPVQVAVLMGLVAAFAGCVSLIGPSQDVIPPTVAVSSFEDRSGYEGPWKLGTGMADLLNNELVGTKCVVVLERERFDHLVSEIERQRGGHFRPEGKVTDGRMKNANYLIRGVITDFSQVGGGSFAVAIRKLFFGGRGHLAQVSLVITIVDVESGQIIDSAYCVGKVRAREGYLALKYNQIAFAGESFYKTPLGQATREAINKGVRAVIRNVPRKHWRPMIAEVNGDVIVLNGGSRRGFRIGQYYAVRGAAKPITDPSTGDSLGFAPGPSVGIVRVTAVANDLAYAASVEGRPFERGQWLERTEYRPASGRNGK